MKGKNIKDDEYWDEVNTKLHWLDDLTGKDPLKVCQVLNVILQNDLTLYRKSDAISDLGQVQDDTLRIPSNIKRDVWAAIVDEEEEEEERHCRNGKENDNIDPSLHSDVSSRHVTPGSNLSMHEDKDFGDKNELDDDFIDPGPNSETNNFFSADNWL